MNTIIKTTVVLTASYFLFFCSEVQQSVNAQRTWSQFRGPDNVGLADPTAHPPTKWDLQSDVTWESEIPGVGWSSPVHDGQRVWVTTSVTQDASPEKIAERLEGLKFEMKTPVSSLELRAICVDIQTGELLHNVLLKEYEDPPLINPLNSYASPTPAISEGKVVCHFGSYGTWCLDAVTGAPLWNARLVVDHSVGPGSSPVIFNGRVILVSDGIDKQFIASLDLNTGDEIWRTHRPQFRTDDGEQRKAYSTPLLIEVNGKQQAVIPGAQWIVAYDPAIGEEIWRFDHGSGFSVTPMATYEAGLIVFCTGYAVPEFVAVDPTGTGDVTQTHLRWKAKGAPAMSSLIGVDGRVFGVNDKGILVCLDATTGELIHRTRIDGNYSASPVLAGGNLYFSNRQGVAKVIQCSTEMKELSSQDFHSSLMASPAIFNNDLIFRTEEKLYRVSTENNKALKK